MVKIMHDEVADPRTHDPSIPSDLAELCLIALSKDPGNRPASARIFAQLLQEILEGPKRRGGLRRRSRLIPGLIAGGVLASGIGGYGFYSIREERRQIEAQRQETDRRHAAEARRLTVDEERRLAVERKLAEERRLAVERELAEEGRFLAEERRLAEEDEPIEQLTGQDAWERSTQIYHQANRAWRGADAARAMELLEEALVIWPQNPMALTLRSKAHARRGNIDQALRDIEMVIDIYELLLQSNHMPRDDPDLQWARVFRQQLLQRRRRY